MPETGFSVQKVVLASDHGGYQLKKYLSGLIETWGLVVVDLGPQEAAAVDYPDFAVRLAQTILAEPSALGVLICGTGIGMSMSANRFPGIRAALCHSAFTARMARSHNDANVLCLGERVTGAGEAEDILRTFLTESFAGGRHQGRIEKIERLAVS